MVRSSANDAPPACAQGLVQLRDVVVDGRAGLEDLQNAVHAELVTAGLHLLDEAVAEDDQA